MQEWTIETPTPLGARKVQAGEPSPALFVFAVVATAN